MKTTIIYDIEISGHHLEYISHLINYIINNNIDEEMKYVFVVHENFKQQYNSLFGEFKENKNLMIFEISALDICHLFKGNVLKRSLNNYKFLISKAKIFNASFVILLHFNVFMLSLILFRNRFKISGILFHQFYRLEKNTISQKLKYLRKHIQTKLLTLNNQITDIYILNDNSTVNSLNSKFRTDIFTMLPDPIPEWKIIDNYNIRKKYRINNNKKIFLHTGSLEERKGVFEILNAMECLEPKYHQEFVLFILGKADVYNDGIINEKIKNLKIKNLKIEIIYKNEFISNSLLKTFFDQCDCVLIPYKKIESSSGIIGHAIFSGKTIIGPDNGLIGEILRDYGNSVLLDEITPETISIAIKQFLTNDFPIKNWEEYILTHTPDLFATIILKG